MDGTKKGAYYTGEYRNLFHEAGYSEEEIEAKLNAHFQTLFYGSEEERIYHPVGENLGYMEDTGNHDARTEGMSYGMMYCVQMDKREEFDRIWNWSKKYMYMDYGESAGYFAWSCQVTGEKNAHGAAPDGEEFYAMSLIFAANRWKEPAYLEEARKLLHTMLHKGENGTDGAPMVNPENYLYLFVPGCEFTDPSYHVPHFYELFADYGPEEDREIWKKVAAASRAYLQKACHPVTGLSAEYSEYDGSPKILSEKQIRRFGSRHDWFFSDAYRTVPNIALDLAWYGPWERNAEGGQTQQEIAEKYQRFFEETVPECPLGIYEIDGTVIQKEEAKHSVGLFASRAQASLASEGPYAMETVKKLFEMPLKEGKYRYYDNCLFFFAFLALSGRYRIWK